jgi:two-component system, cell cycle sensor histidine kinase and response regulator CckA
MSLYGWVKSEQEGLPVNRNEVPEDQPTAGEITQGGGEGARPDPRRFQLELGSAPYGMIATGLDKGQQNTYLTANDAFCQLIGYPQSELIGADFLQDIHPDDQPAMEALTEDLASGATSQLRADARLVRKDGEAVPVHLTGSATAPQTGERYLATYVDDLTSITAAQAEIRRLERELQRLRRLDSLGQLTDGIAHDFNNVLTVIANFASLIRDELIIAEASEGAAKWGPVRWDVEQIEDAADRAKRLIRHLLAFVRREQAPAVTIDVGGLINEASGLLREVLGEHIEVIIRHGSGISPVAVDPGVLEQAIINLALNARDAMPGGGQLVIETANIDTANPGGIPSGSWQADSDALAELLPGQYVGIRVADTGTGMDVTIADRAFEPFFTTKPADQAAGLGLPAVRRIAAQAGGDAWLRSEPGHGTTVTIILSASGGSAEAGTARSYAGRTIRHGAILVVDDEPSMRDVAQRVLTSAGYQVTTAGSGQEAIALLADPGLPVNLVLTDVVMPGLTGEAFAARARDMRPGIQILFMSGYERRGTAAGTWPHPARDVIAKPFSRAALLARVSRALAADSGAEVIAKAGQARAVAGSGRQQAAGSGDGPPLH